MKKIEFIISNIDKIKNFSSESINEIYEIFVNEISETTKKHHSYFMCKEWKKFWDEVEAKTAEEKMRKKESGEGKKGIRKRP